jgi:hypothetical protein
MTSDLLRETKEGNIHVWMLRNGVANTLRAVSNEVCGGGSAVAVDGLCVAALRVVGHLLAGGEAENVGPLLQLLLVYHSFIRKGSSL